MKRNSVLVTAFVTACVAISTAPVSADSVNDGAQHWTHARRAMHHTIPVKVEALAPVRAMRTPDDIDGLTRDTSECNMGCIDN